MSTETEAVRRGIALLLWLVSATMIIHYVFRSLRYALQAAQGHPSLAADMRAPLRHAVFMMFATALAITGLIAWVPQLVALMALWIAVIILVGLSVWANLRLRPSFATKRIS